MFLIENWNMPPTFAINSRGSNKSKVLDCISITNITKILQFEFFEKIVEFFAVFSIKDRGAFKLPSKL